jgi:hypothetical protein
MKDDRHIISDHFGVSAHFKVVENPKIEAISQSDPFLTFDKSFIKQGIFHKTA